MSHRSDLYNLLLPWSRSVLLSPPTAGFGPVVAVCWIIASRMRCLSPFGYFSSLLIEGLKKKTWKGGQENASARHKWPAISMPPLLLFLRQSVSAAVNTVIELTGPVCEHHQASFLSSEAWETWITRISYTNQTHTHTRIDSTVATFKLFLHVYEKTKTFWQLWAQDLYYNLDVSSALRNPCRWIQLLMLI